MLDATKTAIRMPELEGAEYTLEITGRVGDMPVHESPGKANPRANLSEC